jgi:pyruvate formate lyase activating enzyme
MAVGLVAASATIAPAVSGWAAKPHLGYEGSHYKKLSGKRIQCFVCPLDCILEDGETCFCRTRTNIGGTLYNTAYNNPCVLNLDPVEKGPLYHVLPGERALAIGTAGCNMRCLYCQNWAASQRRPGQTTNINLDGTAMVASARKESCKVIAFTYTEPIAFYEYVFESAQHARKNGLLVNVASAAFVNPEPMRELCKVADAFTLALKGFSEEFYKKVCGTELAPVLEAIKIARKEARWLEIVNLVVPTLNDDRAGFEKMCQWIAENLGKDVPLHFARFYPEYKLTNLPPTPQSTMEMAHKIAREAGLNYVYLVNLPGHPANNTYCPNCGNTVVTRVGLKTLSVDLRGDKCRGCQSSIPGIWS